MIKMERKEKESNGGETISNYNNFPSLKFHLIKSDEIIRDSLKLSKESSKEFVKILSLKR